MGFRLPPHLFATLPVVQYAKAHNVRSKPKDYAGEWLVRDRVYAGRVEAHPITRKPHFRAEGLYCPPPYTTFPMWRFRAVATVWLN